MKMHKKQICHMCTCIVKFCHLGKIDCRVFQISFNVLGPFLISEGDCKGTPVKGEFV